MKRVTVPPFSQNTKRPATVVLLQDEEYGRIPVTLEDGTRIGAVRKTSYTYSPPTHKGSRIVRFHRSVDTWEALTPDHQRYGGRYKVSRRDALRFLLDQYGTHEVKISRGYQDYKRTFAAHCSCGWQDDKWHRSEEEAQKAAKGHE